MTRSFPRVLLGRFTVALAVSVPLVLGGVVGVNAFIDRKIDEIPRVKVKHRSRPAGQLPPHRVRYARPERVTRGTGGLR
jgi:4-hydroxybenzoate polyprenyltransferase